MSKPGTCSVVNREGGCLVHTIRDDTLSGETRGSINKLEYDPAHSENGSGSLQTSLSCRDDVRG